MRSSIGAALGPISVVGPLAPSPAGSARDRLTRPGAPGASSTSGSSRCRSPSVGPRAARLRFLGAALPKNPARPAAPRRPGPRRPGPRRNAAARSAGAALERTPRQREEWLALPASPRASRSAARSLLLRYRWSRDADTGLVGRPGRLLCRALPRRLLRPAPPAPSLANRLQRLPGRGTQPVALPSIRSRRPHCCRRDPLCRLPPSFALRRPGRPATGGPAAPRESASPPPRSPPGVLPWRPDPAPLLPPGPRRRLASAASTERRRPGRRRETDASSDPAADRLRRFPGPRVVCALDPIRDPSPPLRSLAGPAHPPSPAPPPEPSGSDPPGSAPASRGASSVPSPGDDPLRRRPPRRPLPVDLGERGVIHFLPLCALPERRRRGGLAG